MPILEIAEVVPHLVCWRPRKLY